MSVKGSLVVALCFPLLLSEPGEKRFLADPPSFVPLFEDLCSMSEAHRHLRSNSGEGRSPESDFLTGRYSRFCRINRCQGI